MRQVVLFIENGRLYSAAQRELAERRKAEQALHDSEERYRTLVEHQGEGLAIVDPQENFVFVNPAGGEILGAPPQRLLVHNQVTCSVTARWDS
jgi:PAS domain-containing protein